MTRPRTFADGLGFVEGPVWLGDGRVALVSMSRGTVLIVDESGVLEEHHVGGGPNGLALGPQGELLVAQNGGLWVATSTAEPGVQVIRDGVVNYLATGMDAPNDLVVGPDGRLWVTDSRTGVDLHDPTGSPPGRVYAVDVSSGDAELMVEGPVFANGLGFSHDGATLYVTGTVEGHVTSYDVSRGGADPLGVLWTMTDGGPDGMALDRDGHLWVAATWGHRIDVVSPTGELVRSFPLPDGSLPTNLCFGGEQGRDLYVTAALFGSLLSLGDVTS